MKLKMKRISYLLLGCFALSGSIYASETDQDYQYKSEDHYKARKEAYKDEHLYKGETQELTKSRGHFEILGGPGGSQLSANSLSSMGITSSESDSLVQTNANAWDAIAGQLGLGYVHYNGYSQPYSDQAQWFPSVEPELNSYYLASNSIKGNVLRFNNAAYNDLHFDIPIRSARLMLDTALTILSKQKLSIYAIGGIGGAWNQIGYTDTDNSGDPCPEARLSLNKQTNWDFAWEVGAGMTYAFNSRVGLSVEYLYASLGHVKTASSGNTAGLTTPIITPARFNLYSSAGLVVLHIAL